MQENGETDPADVVPFDLRIFPALPKLRFALRAAVGRRSRFARLLHFQPDVFFF